VVDAFNFLRDYGSADSLGQRGQSLGDEDTRTVVDLLIEQIEFCDVLVVNKTDLVTTEERERLMAILRSLNPRARIESSEFGRVALDRVLGTGLFDFEQAERAPGWLAELRGEHPPESETYGIRSFVYRARLPFHPQRFWDLVQGEWEGVVRSKGFFWLASRATRAGSWSQAGGACRYGVAGLWWAAVPREHWPADEEAREAIRKNWDPATGDARQELVLIGIGMDEAGLRARLDACLLTDSEMRYGASWWANLPDPFPSWNV
jgi:G3E family GTPase